MKKVLAYGAGCLVGMLLVTLVVASVVFFLFWMVIGIVSFVTWSLPLVIPSVWFAIRLSISIGWVVSIFFVFSKEGLEAVKDFAEDVFKL
jgi:hypothetical protein